jgi:hypothetical protein
MKNHPKLTLTGGMVFASIATALAVKRYFFYRELKNDIALIPWDKESVTWKHYFRKYEPEWKLRKLDVKKD